MAVHNHFEDKIDEDGNLKQEAERVLKLSKLWLRLADIGNYILEDIVSTNCSMMTNIGVRMEKEQRAILIEALQKGIEILQESPVVKPGEWEEDESTIK